MNKIEISRRKLLAASALGLLASCTTKSSRTPPSPLIPVDNVPYIDGLSFLPEDMKDVAQSKLSAIICDVSKVEEVRDADGTPRYQRNFEVNDKAIDDAVAKIENSDDIYVATKGSDIGSRTGCAAFLQFQSCETIGTDLDRIGHFHTKGLRILQLTHHNNNAFAGGAIEVKHSGLTQLGRDGLSEMNRLKILPDIAHGSVPTILQTAKLSKTPVVYSHGACRHIVDHPRCITDEGIKAVADSGGVVGIFMMSFWLTKDPNPTVEHLIQHIRHVIDIGGIAAVGIANDFPMSGQQNLVKLGNDNKEGVKQYLDWWRAMRQLNIPGYEEDPEHVVIPELNNINRMQIIHRALEKDGFSDSEITAIMGGNWQRTLVEVLG